jgi:DNA primase
MSKLFLIRPWKGGYEEVEAEQMGGEYKTLCPFHDDHTPSLSINSEKGLFICFGCDTRGSAQEILEKYNYCDEDRHIVFQELRLRDRKNPSKKYSLPRHQIQGVDDWIYDLKGVRRVLYNLPEVITSNRVFVVEGPKDSETLHDLGLVGTTAVDGAQTKWKPEYNQYFIDKDVIVIPDNDPPGRKHALDICRNLKPIASQLRVLKLPDVKVKGDITDWLEMGHTKDELLKLVEDTSLWDFVDEKKEIEEIPEEPIDTSQFAPLSLKELTDILSITIVRDDTNKLVTFLCMLSIYTEEGQFNTSFNAPSSTGKTYIPVQLAKLFPEKDVIELGYCSPMSFFHDFGKWDKERKLMVLDLSHKIIIFLDQPHQQLLERLRPMLSHDRKELQSKITDKTEKSGTRTKNLVIRGYPSVIFCTAGLKVDEQEITRFLLLSPEVDQKKLEESIHMVFQREANKEAFMKLVDENPQRQSLKLRIKAIKQEKITEVRLHDSPLVEEAFKMINTSYKPRHMRDADRVSHIIKALALLNLWFGENRRDEKDPSVIYTTDEDIVNGFDIWNEIAESNDLNLPPYVWDIYKKVVEPLCKECGNTGVYRMDILKRHYEVLKKPMSTESLRKEILPMLSFAGLIREEIDPADRKSKMVFLVSLGCAKGDGQRVEYPINQLSNGVV